MMREILRLGAILGLVCAIAGASLAVFHGITKDIIIAQQEAELQNKLQLLVPAAQHFEKFETEDGGVYYVGWDNDNMVGAIVEGKATGYGGPMRLLVAIDGDGNVSGVESIEHGETIGIGTRALEPEFLQQFNGIAYDEQLAAGKNVDIITGATVSSRAVMTGVENALELYKLHVLKVAPDDDWDLSKVADGVYEGAAQGFSDEIRVKVTVESGRITAVEVVSINDTPEVYPKAVEEVPERIIEKQHWNVDATSGATVSSKGIMEAVKNALPDMSLQIDQIADGTYEGIGQGFGGEIKVEVEVKDGKVTKINVLAHNETPSISDDAIEKIPQTIIELQSVKVDAVSGATGTSKGLIEAVTSALENAPKR
ncbi:MAG: FMN-binding protein [Firmicutes bacterium]|nr:FMN-binding protein [Bacillota bacterium]